MSNLARAAAIALLGLSTCGTDNLRRVRDEPARTDEGPAPRCGDGMLQAGEACDDGAENGDAWSFVARCNGQCTGFAASCGDGRVEPAHEGCDDAGNADGNGCSASCVVEAGYHCAFEPSLCAPFGFGIAPPTTFMMGAPPTEVGRENDEPETEVTLTRGLAVAETEVSQEAYAALMGQNPSLLAGSCPTCPVDTLSWFDALAYANKRSVSEGLAPCFHFGNVVCVNGGSVGNSPGGCFDNDATNGGIETATVTLNGVAHPADCTGYRLPTEAEWEWAARAGTTTAHWNGELTSAQASCPQPGTNLSAVAWFCANAGGTTHAVRAKLANPWGLYDVMGNVWEWAWDTYGPYPAGPLVDPTGPTSGVAKASRGGSYLTAALSVRSASRASSGPSDRQPFRGVRVVRTLP